MNRKYKVAELFSGIGSQIKALKNIGINTEVCCTCEWDIHAFVAYDAIHNSLVNTNIDVEKFKDMTKDDLLEELKDYTLSNDGKEPMLFSSFKTYSEDVIRRVYMAIKKSRNFTNISEINGSDMEEGIDILTYSFPCQDLSNVGAFHGYNKGIDKDSKSRSSLLWQVGRILEEMKNADISLPRFLMLENVPTLLSQRHKKNFDIWIKDLENLGYVNRYYPLNALDFGLPQNRPRLIMISVYVGYNDGLKNKVLDYLKSLEGDAIPKDYKNESGFYKSMQIKDLLRTDYRKLKLKKEAIECTPNDTVSRRKIWDENPQIVLKSKRVNPKIKFVRTITTKQDRNPNSGNLYFNSGIEGKSQFRYLTPRECFLFMGFTDEDYEKVISDNPEFHKGSKLFPRDKLIRMAGNSIPVKLLEGVFYQVTKIDDLIKEYNNGCS